MRSFQQLKAMFANMRERDKRGIARAATLTAVAGGLAAGGLYVARKNPRLGLRMAVGGAPVAGAGGQELYERLKAAFERRKENAKKIYSQSKAAGYASDAKAIASNTTAEAKRRADEAIGKGLLSARTLSFGPYALDRVLANGVRLAHTGLEQMIDDDLTTRVNRLRGTTAKYVGKSEQYFTERALHRADKLRSTAFGRLPDKERAHVENIQSGIRRQVEGLARPDRPIRKRESLGVELAAQSLLAQMRARGETVELMSGRFNKDAVDAAIRNYLGTATPAQIDQIKQRARVYASARIGF